MKAGFYPSDFVSLIPRELRRTQGERLVKLVDRLRAVDTPFGVANWERGGR